MEPFRMQASLAVLFAVLVSACGARSTNVATPDPVPAPPRAVSPFDPLPPNAETYEGIGVADLRTFSVRAARDVALAQARRELTQNIVAYHVSRVPEIAGSTRDAWVSPISTAVSRIFLIGQRFTEEEQVNNLFWARVYMSKKEVDATIGPSLRRIADELAPAIRDAFIEELKGSTTIEDELRILNEYRNRDRRRSP